MNSKSIIGMAASVVASMLLFVGSVSAQTSPSLMIGLDVSPNITSGMRGTVALIKLDASNSTANVLVPAITFSAAFAGSAGQTTLRNCGISLTNAINTPLNTGSNAVANIASTTTFTFDTPLIVPAGMVRWLGLVCDVDGMTPQVGSTITVGINPSTIGATNASSTAVIIPTASVNQSGSQQTSGTANITSATPVTIPATNTITPGIPNTGAGGEAAGNIAILTLSALTMVVLLGLFLRKGSA